MFDRKPANLAIDNMLLVPTGVGVSYVEKYSDVYKICSLSGLFTIKYTSRRKMMEF